MSHDFAQSEKFLLVDHASTPELRHLVHAFRKAEFIDRQGYEADDIRVEDGGEYDSADHDATMHIVSFREDRIVGCLRLVPTTRRYLLEMFPSLTRSVDYRNGNVWDISRLGTGGEERLGEKILCACFELAQNRGIEALVTFTTDARRDVLRGIGLEVEQLGAEQVVSGRDDEFWTAVGLRMRVNDHQHKALQTYIRDDRTFWPELSR
ncbi:MAG: hypothetical protein EOM26_00555 [Alphaproteobacteria bacterium]|nr:hypothetical protein [Alphaproteobacteria bacterium]